MPIAEINAQTITYEDSGGDGPAILFSHGFLMDHTMFDQQVEHFKDRYRCVTWDERGFGETPATAPFTFWDSADDAVALLDHLGISSATFVGMSQGGFLSLRAALAHPTRVDNLVLIGSEAGVDPPEVLAGYQGMGDHWLSEEPLGDVGQFVAGMILGEPSLMTTWIAIWTARDRQTILHPMDSLVTRDDITDRIQEITCPVLSIHGEEDTAIDISHAVSLQAGVTDGRGLIRVLGAAHAPNMSHPKIVNSALDSFLASVAG